MWFYEINNLHYYYPGFKQEVLRAINLKIGRNEKIVLTGNNGSGKSTLASLMMGLMRPQKGEIILDGKPIHYYTLAQIGRKVGYLFQDVSSMLFTPSVYDEVTFGMKWNGFPSDTIGKRVKELLKHFSLWEKRSLSPQVLSCGQKRMLALACLLALEPEFMILDEPTNGLDPDSKNIIIDLLTTMWTNGRGIMIITHDKFFAQRFKGKIITLNKGRIVNYAA